MADECPAGLGCKLLQMPIRAARSRAPMRADRCASHNHQQPPTMKASGKRRTAIRMRTMAKMKYKKPIMRSLLLAVRRGKNCKTGTGRNASNRNDNSCLAYRKFPADGKAD